MDPLTGASRNRDQPDQAFSLTPGRGLKTAKLAILRAAGGTGALRALGRSRWRAGRFLILAYHGVSLADEHEWSPELYLPATALRERFKVLRDGGYNVLALREAMTRLQSGTLPPRSVVLTFDDGTHDFEVAVVPLLREFGFPAIVYVPTYYAAKEVPVFRMACRYMTWVGREKVVDGAGLTADGAPLRLDTLDRRDAAVTAIEEFVGDGGIELEMETMRLLAGRTGVDFGRFLADKRLRIMSPEDIAALPRDLVEVQLHTHRHKVPLNPDAFRREIDDNRNALAAWRPGTPLDAFCYPSGVTDARFLPWLSELGMKTAVTCTPGLVAPRADPLMLPRLVDSFRLTRLEFESWLTGAGELLPRIPRRERYRPDKTWD